MEDDARKNKFNLWVSGGFYLKICISHGLLKFNRKFGMELHKLLRNKERTYLVDSHSLVLSGTGGPEKRGGGN